MPKPYTFDDLRASLVRRRNGTTISKPRPEMMNPELSNVMVDRMIALIDAMTPEERQLGNVLDLSPARQHELATLTGTSVRGVQGLIAGRRAVDFTQRVYLWPS